MNRRLNILGSLVHGRGRLSAALSAAAITAVISSCGIISSQHVFVQTDGYAIERSRPAEPEAAETDDAGWDRDSLRVSPRGAPSVFDSSYNEGQLEPSTAQSELTPIEGVSIFITPTAAALQYLASPTSAPTATVAAIVTSPFSYTVAAGDSLSSIAAMFGVSLRTITRANGLRAADVLLVGKSLTILPTSGFLHHVANGETLVELAERFGVIPEEILAANGLAESTILEAGYMLLIPETSEADVDDEEPPDEAGGVPRSYDVIRGDTLVSIAARYGVSVEALIAANGLDPTRPLSIGQHLTVPRVDALEHVVRTGDTITSIAALYGASSSAIIQENKLSEPYILLPGRKLLVPAPFTMPDPTPTPPAPSPTANQPTPTTTPTPPVPTSTRRAATATPPVGTFYYYVVSGDTLTKIAARYGVTMAVLAAVNGLDPAKPLAIGQRLIIPAGTPIPPTPSPGFTTTPGATPTRASGTPTRAQTPTRAPATPTRLPPTATRAPSSATPSPTQGDPAAIGEKVATIALKYLGARYLWGGASPETGFDCSGLVMYAYRQAGRPVPRDLWGQYFGSTRIEQNSLRRGDIVFFQNTYKPGLSHDGIYLGSGQFIHAASEKTGVIISRLDNPYWSAHYLGAGRP